MSELFWNKVIGALLATGLLIFVLREVGHIAVHSEAPDELAFAVDLGAAATTVAEEEDTGPVDFGALLRSVSLDAGAATFRAKCSSCHQADKGGPNGIGPAMWDVYGRVAGSKDDFSYSPAMIAYAEPWTAENLYAYLERPQRYIDGTAMNFIGLRKQDERLSVIAFLNSLSDDPAPLPVPLPEPQADTGDVEEAATDEASGTQQG